ncbi:MAG TPA: PF20097 family protein [Thermoplasmata archaeon]|nr:PF20097 family protein [Thermoplasmata archaeon]
MAPRFLMEAEVRGANERYSHGGSSALVPLMSETRCTNCGGSLEPGFVSTTNGSGLFWSHEANATRLRPKGLEVLVPTGFQGTYSANISGLRCPACSTILLRLK